MTATTPDNRLCLLLVDDEPTNLQVLRHILQDDYRLLFARTGPRPWSWPGARHRTWCCWT